MSEPDCKASLEALQADGLGAWTGLPTGCRLEETATALGVEGEPGMWNLGERKAFFRSGRLAGAPAQVWTTTDDSEVLMVLVQDPPFAPSPSAVRELLGQPPLQLDTARGTVPLAGGEWVYPERGVAVFVDEDDQVWQASLYRACSPAEYEAEFRLFPAARRQPLR